MGGKIGVRQREIMRHLGDKEWDGKYTQKDISLDLGMPISTAYKSLLTLWDRGLVVKVDGEYKLTKLGQKWLREDTNNA